MAFQARQKGYQGPDIVHNNKQKDDSVMLQYDYSRAVITIMI